MVSTGKKAERLPKKKDQKHPCDRNCDHFLEAETKMNGVYKRVLCSCTGKALVRSAPPKAHHINCPDHPQYKPATGDREKQALLTV